MFTELAFHGVPQGQLYWGKNLSEWYYQRFYSNYGIYKGAESVLVVDFRKVVEGKTSFYTYIRTNNILSYSGRTGSYFAMSLKFDGKFCTDVYSLYILFNNAYEQIIIDKILKREGDTERYLVSTFIEEDYLLRKIEDFFRKKLGEDFKNDFQEFAPSFSLTDQRGDVAYWNLNDVNSENFFNAAKVSEKVFVSPEYPSFANQIEILREENTLSLQAKRQVELLQSELSAANGKIQKKDSVINSLEDKNKDLNQQLQELRGKSSNKDYDIRPLVSRFESSLTEMLGIMRSVKQVRPPEYTTSHKSCRSKKTNFFKRYLSLVALTLLALSLIFGVLLFQTKKGENNLQNKLQSAEEENKTLSKQLSQLSAAHQSDVSALLSMERSDKYPNASFLLRDKQNNQVETALKNGVSYSVECSGVDDIKGELEWKADGFEITDRKKNPTEIKVNSDKPVLSFYIKKEKVLSIKYKVNP